MASSRDRCLSTPHPSPGESPYKLMTGMDMVLPNFQEWADYSFEKLEAWDRFRLITNVHRICLDNAIRNIMRVRDRAKRRTHKDIEIGDIVLYWFGQMERQTLCKVLSGSKLTPKWSEPCRVVKYCNKEKTAFWVKSIWHDNVCKQLNIHDVMKLPRLKGHYTLEAGKMEMLADLKHKMWRHKIESATNAQIETRGGDLNALNDQNNDPTHDTDHMEQPDDTPPSDVYLRDGEAKKRKLHTVDLIGTWA